MPVTTFPRDTRYPEPLCDRCGVVWVLDPKLTTCAGCTEDGGAWALNHARARAMRALGLPHPWAPGSAAAHDATLGALRFFGGLCSAPSTQRQRVP
jgi:hypothetical protein